MNLRRNFSFNQKNIVHKNAKSKTKNNNKNNINNNNLNRIKSNYNIKGKMNKQEMDEDISFYNNIATLKKQIFSPENDEDIHLYNNNKKMEKKIIYEDEKNSNYDFRLARNTNVTNNKKTLILDLDETLVHSLFKQEKSNNLNNNFMKPDIYLKIFFNNKIQEIFVYKRPYLDIFLKEMNKIYNIYVFTASIEKYAKPLLKKLDKNNFIIKKFYRESCLLSEGKFIKNLNSLNLNIKMKDIIIIDNNPFSFKFNKNNGIPIKSWHFDKSDSELIKIIPLLKYLAKTNDVRKYIPFIIKNDEINFENINKILQKKQTKVYKTINYNNNENNNMKINYNTNTINFREPQKNKNKNMKIIKKNFNKKYNNINSKVIYRNDNRGYLYKNTSIGINFNSSENNNNSNNKEQLFKSYNNFYINNKYLFNLENEKNYENNINNIIKRYKTKKLKKKNKIPIDTKSLNKINNKTSRIFRSKIYKKNIIKDNDMIKHCLSYKNLENNINSNSNINNNYNYNELKNHKSIETYFQPNNLLKNIIIDRNNNLIKSNYNEKIIENKKQDEEKFYKNEFEKRRMKLKNILYRNSMNNYNKNIKSYSYTNFPEEI